MAFQHGERDLSLWPYPDSRAGIPGILPISTKTKSRCCLSRRWDKIAALAHYRDTCLSAAPGSEIHNALQAVFLKDHIAAETIAASRRLHENASRFLQGLLGDSGPFQRLPLREIFLSSFLNGRKFAV